MIKKLGLDVRDLLLVLGFAGLLYGIAHWSTAAAWVVFGLLLMGAASAPLRKKGTR
jgi:hypothetical protein